MCVLIEGCSPRQHKRTRWRRLGQVGLCCLSLITSIIVADVVLSWLRPPMLGGTYDKEGLSVLAFHPVLGQRYKANWKGVQSSLEFSVPLATNAEGFPGPVIPDSPDHDCIVLLGDSYTAGYGVPWDSSFPAVAEKALDCQGKPVTVSVLACSGWGQYHELAALKLLADRRSVRAVGVVICAENDVFDNWQARGTAVSTSVSSDTVPTPPMYWGAREYLRKSTLAGCLYLLWCKTRGGNEMTSLMHVLSPVDNPITPEMWGYTGDLLREMKQWCERRAIHFFAVLIPPKWEVSDDAYYAAVPTVSNRAKLSRNRLSDGYRQLLNRDCIRYIDLTACLQASSKSPYYVIDAHWSPLGHRIAGETLASFLASVYRASNHQRSLRSKAAP